MLYICQIEIYTTEVVLNGNCLIYNILRFIQLPDKNHKVIVRVFVCNFAINMSEI